ncbi:hypothetical protein AH547_09705 [Salmonella enterica subsp. enterica]|nr:hypothetical protein [Salmonella enterica subsp. enterica serovar Javiana]ECH9478867.1 hypothetical protein [Salmonella enterica subsp. enterica]
MSLAMLAALIGRRQRR